MYRYILNSNTTINMMIVTASRTRTKAKDYHVKEYHHHQQKQKQPATKKFKEEKRSPHISSTFRLQTTTTTTTTTTNHPENHCFILYLIVERDATALFLSSSPSMLVDTPTRTTLPTPSPKGKEEIERATSSMATTTTATVRTSSVTWSAEPSNVIDDTMDDSLASTSNDSNSLEHPTTPSHEAEAEEEDVELTFLCELVGARNLTHQDDYDTNNNNNNSSSVTQQQQQQQQESPIRMMKPYCVVQYGEEFIHKTQKAADPGRNPIWTVSTKSLFLIKATPKEMSHKILNISIFDKQRTKSNTNNRILGARRIMTTAATTVGGFILNNNYHHQNDSSFLGQVNIDGSTILKHCNEERLEITLEDELGEETSTICQGTIALRFRLATESDQRIVQLFSGKSITTTNNTNNTINNTNINPSSSSANPTTLSSRQRQAFANLMVRGRNPNEQQQQQQQLNSCGSGGGGSGTTNDYYYRPIAKLVTETSETEIVQSSFVNALHHVFSSRTIRDPQTGTKRIRVKPGPDPNAIEETEFLSSSEISLETKQPSYQWVEAGSGTIGRLYLEILSCHDLPNVDVGEAVGNVTDSFVCAVYEDTVAMTDVIDDELCPHWLPWTQRAFSFGMMHPASILYLGVFDYDLGIGTHEPLGRVAVNVGNLQRNTVYTLKYNLYPSSNVTDRTANGSITIRLRIECFNEKAALLAALQPRPKIHVNVHKEKSFRVIRYTCFGEYDVEEKFDLTVIRSYIDEILTYKRSLSYVMGDAISSLIFWRGQVQILNTTIMIPLYSFLFFLATTTLIERPYLIIPFTLLSLAMMMMATLTLKRQHPSPWNRCPSFMHYLLLLLQQQQDGSNNGDGGDFSDDGSTVKKKNSTTSPTKRNRRSLSLPSSLSTRRNVNIKEYEGWDAAQAYDKAHQKRLEQDRVMAEKKAALQQEIDTIGDENISTKLSTQGAIPLELLNKLGRYQGTVGRICKKFRFIKIIVTWEESVVSFWLTAGFLAAGIISLLLPWAFILTWTSRIFVWGLLGPHMKIVDLTLQSSNNNNNNNNNTSSGGTGDENDENGVTVQKLVENFQTQFKLARMRREETVKIKDIKQLAFGKYSIQVPSYNLARHHDRPLPQSCARVCRQTPKKRSGGGVLFGRTNDRRLSRATIPKLGPWIPGQQLYGTMIPRPEHEVLFYQQEAEQEKNRLIAFEERVKAIMDSEGMSIGERLRLCKMGFLDAAMPSTMGYEVVPLLGDDKETDDEDDDDDDSKNANRDGDRDGDLLGMMATESPQDRESRVIAKRASKRFSVIQTDDANPFTSLHRANNQIVLVSDRFSTYEVISERSLSDAIQGEVEEEDGEGVEIVGLGRFSTIETDEIKQVTSDESEGWETETIGTDSAGQDGGLSPVMYQSSERISLAFYRP